jgi:hypothetical protein
MIKRKLTLFLLIALAWTTGVAVIGILNMPTAVLPYAFAHVPRFVFQVFVLWVLCPATIALVLVIGPVAALGRFGAFFSKLINRGREVPPDRETWATRVVVVTTLFMAFGQAWPTLALVLYWRRGQLPWVAEAMRGPHYAGLPDPHHLSLRLWLVAGGVLVAWFGNGLPKLLSPFRGGTEPYDWGKMIRACGWSMTLGGLAAIACALLVPDLHTSLTASAAILVTAFAACLPIWAAYRFRGGDSGVAPPEGM